MTLNLNLTSHPVHAPAPQMIADKRPTADTAAIVRDPRPQVPTPLPAAIPPSVSQKAEVSKSSLGADKTTAVSTATAVTQAERVLKPYGVAMLPRRDGEAAALAVARDPAEGAAAHPQDDAGDRTGEPL